MFEIKSIFDVLKEADDDFEVDTNMDAGDSGGGDENSSGDDNSGNDTDNQGGDDNQDNNEEDDFNIDTDLSADDGGEEDNGEGGDDIGGDLSTNSSTSSSSDDEKPIQANTDIFSSLTKEEQQLKIGELKNMFSEIYSRLDDVMERVNDIDPDKVNFNILTRISSSVYRFRNYLAEYIVKVFPTKSYIENKIQYFKYLTVVNTMTLVVEDIIKEKQKEEKNQ